MGGFGNHDKFERKMLSKHCVNMKERNQEKSMRACARKDLKGRSWASATSGRARNGAGPFGTSLTLRYPQKPPPIAFLQSAKSSVGPIRSWPPPVPPIIALLFPGAFLLSFLPPASSNGQR
ncbi:hypothetical protein HPP92_022019 [Vanilla planifolia]|uniref:Uncharacterized protein n=1 Tax=Vanilla planifolia TaxID=51239 RepID=A0A835UGU8_VANPL|nr:hypothetical protein HPP92_022019 [Vanilla planifolia]